MTMVNALKLLNTFLFLFSNKILVFRTRICENSSQNIANREDPDQTASSEAV